MPHKQRTWTNLRRNHSNALPRYIIAYDTETRPTLQRNSKRKYSHAFRLGVAISGRYRDGTVSGRRTHYIHSPTDFWELLDKFSGANFTTWVVAHNALFDLVVSNIADAFESGRYVIEWPRSKRTRENNCDDNVHCKTLCVIDSPPTIIACKNVATGGRIVFVDTLNWFPVALSSLGSSLGLPKLPMPAFDDTDDAWRDYCERDTEIVLESFVELMRWVRENDMGMFRYTAPSQSMAAFRHRFMRHEIQIHDNAQIKKLERSGYFGGRTEVFKAGEIKQQVHQLDVTSLYPHVMKAGNFPRALIEYEIQPRYTSNLPDIDWASCIAEVVLDTPHAIYPMRLDNAVLFPVGEFQTVLCGPELSQAIRQGRVKAIRSWSHYDCQPIFTEFVDGLWGLRLGYKQAGNELYDQFAKRIMNSLYGKFGQRSPGWVNVPGVIAPVPWSQWTKVDKVANTRHVYRSFGWQVQEKCEREEIDGTFVAISAFVSAAGRVYMNRIRGIAGNENVYYQGVDSIVCTDSGLDRLGVSGVIGNDQLGVLRHQISTDYGTIIGCNDYRLGEKIVLSSRSRTAEIDEHGRTMQRHFVVAQSLFDKSPTATVTEDWRPWERVGNYWKGTIGVDGWTHPLVMTTPLSGSIGGDSADATTVCASSSINGVSES